MALMGVAWIGSSLVPLAAEAKEARACSLRAGRFEREIDVRGTPRRYSLSIGPAVPGGAPPPVVFIWHGWGGSPEGMLRAFEPARLWRDAIFVAAQGLPRRFPGLGLRRNPGWQVEGGEFEGRDVALFDALRKALLAEGCADPTRIYSTGFSNGGYFSNLLGCERAETLAAIAPVSGGGPRAKKCGGPMPVLITHSTQDQVVPYAEGEESFRMWRTANNCSDSPAAEPGSCVEASGCAAPARFCTHAAGHRWPFEAAQHIVDFLRTRHR